MTKKKTPKKNPAGPPSRSPYHPIMMDLSGVSEKEADLIEDALAKALRERNKQKTI